ncbi:MAG: phosphopantothenate/pantothenate synthetase [Candidatus Diapherotrites archaeon]|nr:phosphopantothenate/pantothenate synthetase [Candidatus Diapherotrites archaeon]
MKIPASHPRRASLGQRHALEKGLKIGIVTPTGMIAFGRGEAFDYLLGEKTSACAKQACQAGAALLLLSKKPVLSVNGNATMLCAKDAIKLAKITGAQIEANVFYPPVKKRRQLIARHFENFGKKILGKNAAKKITGLSSNRGMVEERGIFSADTVLVMIEDGDRTQALRKNGKKIIAIDLNPKSRTAQSAHVTIVDNVVRALPEIARQAHKLRNTNTEELEKIVSAFDNWKNLEESLALIKKRA